MESKFEAVACSASSSGSLVFAAGPKHRAIPAAWERVFENLSVGLVMVVSCSWGMRVRGQQSVTR